MTRPSPSGGDLLPAVAAWESQKRRTHFDALRAPVVKLCRGLPPWTQKTSISRKDDGVSGWSRISGREEDEMVCSQTKIGAAEGNRWGATDAGTSSAEVVAAVEKGDASAWRPGGRSGAEPHACARARVSQCPAARVRFASEGDARGVATPTLRTRPFPQPAARAG